MNECVAAPGRVLFSNGCYFFIIRWLKKKFVVKVGDVKLTLCLFVVLQMRLCAVQKTRRER